MSYMCETLENEKNTCQDQSSTCSSDQLAYKQIFVMESTVFYFSTVVSSQLLFYS
jgi:hypothetical protein